jgi:hypothetical protein
MVRTPRRRRRMNHLDIEIQIHRDRLRHQDQLRRRMQQLRQPDYVNILPTRQGPPLALGPGSPPPSPPPVV